jgi:hypothetical protein
MEERLHESIVGYLARSIHALGEAELGNALGEGAGRV